MRTSEWILALVVSVATIALTTAVLIFVDAEFATPGLIYGYLFTVTVAAIYFGSTVAFMSAARQWRSRGLLPVPAEILRSTSVSQETSRNSASSCFSR